MSKIDYKKDYKNIYIAKKTPSVIKLDIMKYITIEYLGNPNNDRFKSLMSALYSLSYTVKMKSKQRDDYYDYVVFPLEGQWGLIDTKIGFSSKDNLKGKLMIRQPDFLDKQLFEKYKKILLEKEKTPEIKEYLSLANFEMIEEGLNVQMLHIGSYDEEIKTFNVMDEFCKENNYQRISKSHKEIYLSDPRKVSVEKLRTVLRYKIKNI